FLLLWGCMLLLRGRWLLGRLLRRLLLGGLFLCGLLRRLLLCWLLRRLLLCWLLLCWLRRGRSLLNLGTIREGHSNFGTLLNVACGIQSDYRTIGFRVIALLRFYREAHVLELFGDLLDVTAHAVGGRDYNGRHCLTRRRIGLWFFIADERREPQ